LVSDYKRIAGGKSNSEGRDVLRVPADAPLQSLYAFKSGLGLDYWAFPHAARATTGDVPQPPDLNKPLILKLTGARTVRIRLLDPAGQPIVGMGVFPWYFQKPEWGRLDDLNVSGTRDFRMLTDATGTAAFDWIPTWNEQAIIFWPGVGDQWTHDRIVWEPQKDPPEMTAQLQRTVPVRGRRHLQEVFGDHSKSFRNYYVISSPVNAKQIEAAKAVYSEKWDVDLFDGSWPVFCILDTRGRTLAVKNTRQFVRAGRVDDSLVNEFLQQYARTLPTGE
jgi:hypothetical protein